MGVDIQGKLRLALGTMKDHASVGKAMMYNHEGKGLCNIEVAVVRATGHDNGPIDDKHMHEILFLVSNSPGSIPFLAERISRRLGKTRDRLVALKTLLLVHRLLRGGNRYFEQQLRCAHASGHLQMSPHCFLIKQNPEPSFHFLHKYAAYLEERIGWVINQAGKLEPVMSQGDLEFRCYDEKSVDMVFRKVPKCQVFIDRVLDCSPFDIFPCDNLAQAAMCNTLKESFQVYKKYCEGIAVLVNMFFDLTRPARALACQILKRASHQSLELYEFYQNCRRIIGNKHLEYPLVQIITMDHVLALEKCSSYIATSKPENSSPVSTKNVPAKLHAAMTGKMYEVDGISNVSLESQTLFSCTLETKMSKVWVVFEDEDLDSSRVSL
ncbi:hypothetical protein Tsubulata_042983 [Turnera subulata]|uniref:ENTH domain-containing protein n=1 Tax=Turnera subulata TaxID=218843 RepID=A0A9Q0F4F6_9ROSI|nr:hypothetical protein Tsubulata_042983 [Turnera subulata]